MEKRSSRHWTEDLFLGRADLFMPSLVERIPRGVSEATAIAKLFREHGVPRKGRILDLCCGIGRHAVPLARRGFHVLGVDFTPAFVKGARRYAATNGVTRRARFRIGDYRDLSSSLAREPPFDGVLNTFTSIGCQGEDVDRRVFAQLSAHVVAGGVFVLKTINRDWILSHFEDRAWWEHDDLLQLEERTFDATRSHMVNRWEFYRRRGEHLRSEGVFTIDHRVYSPWELKALLESTGWRVRSIAANFEGDPIDIRYPNRTEVVLVAKKQGRIRRTRT